MNFRAMKLRKEISVARCARPPSIEDTLALVMKVILGGLGFLG